MRKLLASLWGSGVPSADSRRRNGRGFWAFGLLGIILVLAGPLLFDVYLVNILIKAFFFAVVALTVDVLWGYTGFLSFGQSAFFGIGAYSAGLIFTHQGFSTGHAVLAFCLAVGASAITGGVIGWLSFYRGASPFFATIMSLVLPIVLTQLILSGGEWTGSSSGLTGFDTFDLSLRAWYWIAGGGLIAGFALMWTIVRSDGGRILTAIRDNESRCSFLGIRTPLVKILLLIGMAAIAGASGFGYAAFSGVVAPELGGFVFGTELIIWVALGGRGTLWGPLVGAVLINVASSYLGGSMPFAWQLILGSAFVVVIVLLPEGLIPWLLKPLGLGRVQARKVELIPRSEQKSRSTTGESAFVMEGVSKKFGSLTVLQGIDLRAEEGELVGIIGPNGAGKTTLMRCMSDGAERSSGIVRLCGNDILRLPPEQCVRFGLGRKFQNANVFESLSVADCLRIASARRVSPSWFRRSPVLSLPLYALDVLRMTALEKKLDLIARDLSHGEQQALELAMVLALQPRIVLLDEPTAGLTKTERTQIGQVLAALAKRYKLCCLLVEHDLDFVEEVATRVVVLHQGQIVMDGTFSDVVNSELVRTIYSGTAQAGVDAEQHGVPAGEKS